MEPSSADRGTPWKAPDEPALDWSALMEAYRVGPKESWSGLLIERLGPWLTTARRSLVAVPPFLDEEDVAQQLVLEVLRIAARWQPICDDCWIPRKLVEAAARRVRGSLSRERSSLAVELDEDLQASQSTEPELAFDIPIGKASAADLRVLFRVKVLGEPIAALAREAGITPRQMRQRVWAARERARAGTSVGDDKA